MRQALVLVVAWSLAVFSPVAWAGSPSKALAPSKAQKVAQALEKLSDALASCPQASKWHRQLLTDQLVRQLALGQAADVQKLRQVLQACRKHFPPGQKALVQALAQALESWIAQLEQLPQQLAQLVRQAQKQPVPQQLRSAYHQHLEQLLPLIKKAPAELSPEQRRTLLATLLWLRQHQLAPQLQQVLQQRYLLPGGWILVKRSLVQAVLPQPEVEAIEIDEVIQGAVVEGQGELRMRLTAELVPSAEVGRVVLVARGHIQAQTTSSKGRIQVQSRSLTRFQARKPLLLLPTGLSAQPAQVQAESSSEPLSVSTPCRCGLAQRVVWRGVMRRLPAAEAESANKAKHRIAQRMDRQVAEQLEDINAQLESRLLEPLRQQGALPGLQALSTTGSLMLLVRQTRMDLPPTVSTPPPMPPEADLVLLVHERLVNNYAQWLYGGQSLSREELEKRWGDLFPPPQKEQPNWRITFARRRPIELAFRNGELVIRVRGVRFGRQRQPMLITIRYQLKSTAGEVVAVRKQLVALPPGATEDSPLSARQVALKRQLEERFGETFGPQLFDQPIPVAPSGEEVGQLEPVALHAQDGWLQVAWRFVPAAGKASTTTTSAKQVAKRQ